MKLSCDEGACGGCTVILEGRAALSCMLFTVGRDGKRIIAIEGLRHQKKGELDPLQESFIDHTPFHCDFCTPGVTMSAKGLLSENPSPTKDEVKGTRPGNFCRSVSRYHVVRAITAASSGREVGRGGGDSQICREGNARKGWSRRGVRRFGPEKILNTIGVKKDVNEGVVAR